MHSSAPVAVVTGGASGIGFAASQRLAREGFLVVIADLDLSSATAVAREMEATGVRAESLQLDVTDTDSVDGMVDKVVSDLGRIDTLVTCAGIVDQEDSRVVSDESWSRMLATHLDGTFRCCRAAYSALVEAPHGSIVTVSSVVAQLGLPRRLSYAVAKSGVEALTRTLAVEWARDGIRVNAVAPGWTRTRVVDAAIRDGIVDEARLLARIPLGRLAEPEEIARVIAFLATRGASYISGQVVIVDGCTSIGFAT